MEEALAKAMQDLDIDPKHILNIYNYGSHSYGLATEESDYDFIIVTDYPSDPTTIFFTRSHRHDFVLHKDPDGTYDVVIYTLASFKKLLEMNSLVAIECLFLPEQFKIQEKQPLLDFYLQEAFDPIALRGALFYEQSLVFCICKYNIFTDRKKALKNYFHLLRYFCFVYELLTTKSITDFQAANEYYPVIMKHMTDKLDWDEFRATQHELYSKLRARVEHLLKVYPHEVSGLFEYHVTVDTDNMKGFKALCKEKGCKPIIIELARGVYSTQVMSSSYHRGKFPDAILDIHRLGKEFEERGYHCKRLKIESMASNPGIPITRGEHYSWGPGIYFEFHYKVQVYTEGQYLRLCEACTAESKHLHVSKNPIKPGFYYVTLRCFQCGKKSAMGRHKKTLKFLEDLGYPALKNEREFVVYDTNLELDTGW